jgi:LCCL domain
MATSPARRITVAAVVTLSAMAALTGCKKRNRNTDGPPAVAIPWSGNATAFRAQLGATLAFECPPNGRPGSVWGTDTYTTDSSICTAAVHSGRIQLQTGGVVQIQIAPGMPRYQGTVRGGIASFNFASYPGSFTIVGGPAPGMIAVPVPGVNINGNGINIGGLQINVGSGNSAQAQDPWRTNGIAHRGQIGTSFVHTCPPGGTFGSVWGTGIFSDDSSICTAAVHAGRLQQASGGPVTVFVHPGRANYQGSMANGVTSRDFGRFSGSFSFDAVAPPEVAVPAGTEALSWTQSASQWRDRRATTIRVFCPPGSATGSVWGSNPYTDDSSICAAAVHYGRIRPETGGNFGVRIFMGLSSYRGSVRNGVTTRDFARFPGSFMIVP